MGLFSLDIRYYQMTKGCAGAVMATRFYPRAVLASFAPSSPCLGAAAHSDRSGNFVVDHDRQPTERSKDAGQGHRLPGCLC
jgi:hypothetical protein